MNNLIDYIVQNREWIFSGIGALILASIWGFLYKKLYKPKSQSPSKSKQTVVNIQNELSQSNGNIAQVQGNTIVGDVNINQSQLVQQSQTENSILFSRISKITYDQIREAIEKVPPLQQEDVKKYYIGIKVDWQTVLVSAGKKDKDKVILVLKHSSSERHYGSGIVCVVSLNEYRELATLHKGTPIRVVGDISEFMDFGGLLLTNVQLFI